MISAIVYNSKTGSCERYAKELSRKLVIPCYAQGSFRPRADAKVIYVSWIMAGKVVGLSKAVKKMDVGAVVAVGMAPAGKKAAEAMRQAIQEAIDADGLNARVVIHTGLVSDYCTVHHIHWYVRGLRNAADYDYEEGNAQVNALLNPNVETLYLRGGDNVLSSSMIRELMAFGKDVSEFVPASVMKALKM